MVEQLGLAIILSSLVKICELITGIINFLLGSIRQAEELSMTTVQTSANFGAHSNEMLPPAENSAISGAIDTAVESPKTSKLFP